MNKIRGYKVFNPDWTCRGKQYTCPGTFEEEGDVIVCHSGMHFCQNVSDCFNYYPFNSNNRVAEVIAYGDVHTEGNKSCTNKLEIVREIPWKELLTMVNIGKDCTGLCNTGNHNTGNWNTGDYNTGHCNTGNWNTRNHNTGNWNTGDYNTGHWNTGNYNTGHCNTRDCNIGNYNTGNCNTGDWNTGNYNTGHSNTGYYNTGDWNTGDYNTGHSNTGHSNTGNYNTGHSNTGNCNTGNCNTGDYNTGDWNISPFNVGCFNTEEQNIMLFNKPSSWTYMDWQRSRARYLLTQIKPHVLTWIPSPNMSTKEKEEHPEHKTTGGYLKTLNKPESAQLWWDGLKKADKNVIKSIPNFDAQIFEKCTGIKVC